MTTLKTQIPDQLCNKRNIWYSWVAKMHELFAESMRRYQESHREAMTEEFIREDLEWGLHGAG